MKIVPHHWKEVSHGQKYEGPEGLLRLQLSGEAAIFVESEGVEVCATFASSASIQVNGSYRFWVSGEVRVFVHAPHIQTFGCDGPVFTNADNMPVEGHHMAEITRKMREFQLMQAGYRKENESTLRRIASATARLKKATVPEPEADVDPEADGDADT